MLKGVKIQPCIDVSAYNEDAFINACIAGKLDVALWLQGLKPYLYIIYYLL